MVRIMPDNEHLQYIYHFDPVRPELVTNPGAWTEAEVRNCQAHFAYLQKATREGGVLLAGRSLDVIGQAVVIIEVESEDAACEFMKNDPFVASGLMRASLHPFRAALVRE